MLVLTTQEVLEQLVSILSLTQTAIRDEDFGLGIFCGNRSCTCCIFTMSDLVSYEYSIYDIERLKFCKLLTHISKCVYEDDVLSALGLSYVLEERLIELIEDIQSKYKIEVDVL